MLKSDSERLREIRIAAAADDDDKNDDNNNNNNNRRDSPIGVSRLRGFMALVGVTENIRYEWILIGVD